MSAKIFDLELNFLRKNFGNSIKNIFVNNENFYAVLSCCGFNIFHLLVPVIIFEVISLILHFNIL